MSACGSRRSGEEEQQHLEDVAEMLNLYIEKAASVNMHDCDSGGYEDNQSRVAYDKESQSWTDKVRTCTIVTAEAMRTIKVGVRTTRRVNHGLTAKAGAMRTISIGTAAIRKASHGVTPKAGVMTTIIIGVTTSGGASHGVTATAGGMGTNSIGVATSGRASRGATT